MINYKIPILVLQSYSKTMEIDHIFPSNGIKISEKVDRILPLNHIGNLCYLSKLNNQKKSNTLPNDYIVKLLRENNSLRLREFNKQTYWPELLNEEIDGNIKSIYDFKSFLNLRMKKVIRKIIIELEVS